MVKQQPLIAGGAAYGTLVGGPLGGVIGAGVGAVASGAYYGIKKGAEWFYDATREPIEHFVEDIGDLFMGRQRTRNREITSERARQNIMSFGDNELYKWIQNTATEEDIQTGVDQIALEQLDEYTGWSSKELGWGIAGTASTAVATGGMSLAAMPLIHLGSMQ